MIRRGLKKIASHLGYEISKIHPKIGLDAYRSLFGHDSVRRRAFYNIGAGSFHHPAWTNVDADSDWYKCNRENTLREGNIAHDLLSLKPFPIETGSAGAVYTSHTVEHVTDEADDVMFKEAYRILRAGGVFRITTNSTDLAYRAYRTKDRSYYYWADAYATPSQYREINLKSPMSTASLEQLFLFDFAGQLTTLADEGAPERLDDREVNRLFSTLSYEEALEYCRTRCNLDLQKRFPGFHINWFNADKITRMLRRAGFTDVYVSGWGQSVTPIFRDTRYFDKVHPKISVYVEAVR